jgi:cyclic pyranopterin phosphate synthase
VDLEVDEHGSGIHITATAKTEAKTGVEMEALTAVSVAALTLYDMCKSVDRGMRIQDVRLVSKRGGKSGDIVLES